MDVGENPFTKSHPRDAWQYAADVLNGEIPACKYVKLACQRFMNDLKRDDIVFKESVAQRVCNFYETLPHVKDHWANTRQLFKMEPWQKFTECNIFGWYWPDTDQRRFRESYEELPRKSGKSFKVAARCGYTFCADGVFGSEVYVGATSEKQAWEVFGPIRLIFQRNEQLRQHFNVEVNAKNLHIITTGSKCEPIIGNPGDGSSPSHAVSDEYHEHDTDKQVQTMITGMGARAMHGSPLMSYITTAGDNMGGPCYEKRQEVIKILEGMEDDSIFGIIYTIDEDDQWDTDEAIIKANPNLDVSVSFRWLKDEMTKARRSALKQNEFKTKHLNIWVGARSAWMNMLAWQKQKRSIKLDDFKGKKCFVSIDLASKKDLASICILFREDGFYYTFEKFYAPESAVQENDKYQEFVTKGEVIETPGTKTDYAFIEEELKQLAKDFEVEYFIFDPWQASYLITRMQENRLPVMELPMTTKNLSDAMKEVEANILSGELFHDGNTCMTWQMGNVTSKIDARNNIYPRKANDNDHRCHIDGPVTLIMAMTRWQLVREAPKSIYEQGAL